MSDHLAGINLRDSVFPGGSLLEGYFHRDVVRLSDRGGASGLIGDRWSNLVAQYVSALPGTTILTAAGESLVVSRVVRLDDHPRLSSIASKRKLQNPDFLIIGSIDDRPAAMSLDAKYSIETAKSSQVSAESLDALLEIGPRVTDLMGLHAGEARAVDGVFVSPDSPMTHYMLGRRRGFRSASVSPGEAHLIPVTPVQFLKPLEGATLIPQFAETDGYEAQATTNLLLATYEFRLVRAAIGCWLERHLPLFGKKQPLSVDVDDVARISAEFAHAARSAWDIVLAWDTFADATRRRREQVQRATTPLIVNKQVRAELEAAVPPGTANLPSMNHIRRRIAQWYQGEIANEIGGINHDVENFPEVLADMERVASDVSQRLPAAQSRIIREAVTDAATTPSDDT